ncbi:hypothetical protein [Clostridium sp. UBA5119]|uniref:hypothetical protein n=1 Tax=Clostridium sp. UBA5119 TaxID=1946366 RepID=UPI003217994F
MDLKSWNDDIKELRKIILKPDKIQESKSLALSLHSMVHLSIMSGVDKKTFEDELWEGLDESAVLDVKASNWLIDFWGRKNVAGIILMPMTRHQVIHINESLSAKKKSKSKAL